MNRATQAGSPGKVPAVTYRLEMKAADWPDPAAPEDAVQDPNPADPGAREWAGDLYEEGDESDPVQAFAVLTGDDGTEAWLDKQDDGTLIGWVRDAADDSLYRYTDPEAWAADVDGAGMSRVEDAFEVKDDAEGDEPADQTDEADPDADGDDDTNPDSDTDGDAEGLEQEPTADDTGAPDEQDMQLGEQPDDETLTTDEDAEQNTDELESDDEDFFTRMKKKGEGKAFALHVTPAR